MSNVCCKEFARWIKSFTKTERVLTVLEALLLAVLITLLILLILHCVACSKPHWAGDIQTTTTQITTYKNKEITKGQTHPYMSSESTNATTLGSDVRCSWTPSAKTSADIRYYEDGRTQSSPTSNIGLTTPHPLTNITTQTSILNESTGTEMMEAVVSKKVNSDLNTTTEDFEDLIQDELSSGEDVEYELEKYVAALVKFKPPKDIVFGCILTIVSQYWTLTAASCIEAIEETDSLDSFVMMREYGTNNKGPLHPIDDVQIHPLYEGKNRTYDLAALKSAGSLTGGSGAPIELASFLDFALLPLAERFIILGYGAYRSIDTGPGGRRLRHAVVYKLPVGQCGAGGGGGGAELRHLSAGREVGRGACGPPALCAGVLYSRGLPCNYCAGTPLVVAAGAPALLGLMAAGDQCAVSCEPALYVNLADVDVADWVDATLRADTL